MSVQAITVQGLGKRYRIGKAPASVEGKMRFVQKLVSPFNYLLNTLRKPEEDEIIWALRDVSFDVDYGEVVGIIGRNGAGKSTLLKILSRITDPTLGRAVVNGRVGSLLEVGTGFHPELTGRENIYLNGAILGMKRSEIEHKFDEIVAFAEVDKFLDTPVKRYSSGMYVRLAFAVAAHLEPEILLVDEVLAVGDASFQKKCLGKMSDVAKQGRTVIFVSHNMVAVQNLCERVIWLNDGAVKSEGPTNQVLSDYLSSSYSSLREQSWPDMSSAPGNDKVRLHRVRVRPENDSPDAPITMETPLLVEVEYWNLLPNHQLHLTLHFYTEQHIVAFSSVSIETDDQIRGKGLPKGLYRSICHIPPSLLNSGIHKVLLLFVQNTDKIIYRHEDALAFEVLEMERRYGSWFGKEPGAVHPKLLWTTETKIETANVIR
jgi:lipopolysaccharide transport system ATP-binding protein